MTPTFSSAGRPAGNLSSTTHCRNSSQNTGQLSSRPYLSRRMARSRSVVAGVMRSTIELGKATLRANPAREVGIDQLGETGDRVLGDVAVAGNVVAGHHREGRDAGRAAALQAGDDQAEGGLRRVDVARR